LSGSPDPESPPLVTAAIIGWNGGEDIQGCVRSVLGQTARVGQRVLVDNHSTDGSVEAATALDPDLEVIRNQSNVGFARAANQAFAAARGSWLLLLNQDVVLETDYVERLLEPALKDASLGSLTGKLLRPGTGDSVVDSTGHILYRNGWAANRGELEPDQGQFEAGGEVFGVCAAAALYRVAMLKEASSDAARPFDERFFAYIEDVDLDWRARWLGWRAWYVPAVAWHRRSASNAAATAAQARRTVANRLLVVANNDLWPSGLIRLPGVLAFAVLGALRSRGAALGPFDALRVLPESRRRRRFLAAHRRVDAGVIASWMRPYPFRDRLRGLFRKRSLRYRRPIPPVADPRL
jgi:GT2 family glycosyltransferase